MTNSIFIGLKHLSSYQSSWLRGDLLAGVTVAAYLIPQCMAYAELAGAEPVVGLWAILPPMIIYTIFGSSSQLSVGPESTTAVMTAVTISPILAQANTNINYANLSGLLAVLVGITCIMGYFAKLGFLAELLSKPILVGYMAGVAIIMIVGQLSKISGIKIDSDEVFEQIIQFLTNIDQIHFPTFILAIFILAFLIIIQNRFPKLPGSLLAILLTTVIVNIFHLDKQGVAIIGEIPAKLPNFTFPYVSFNHLTYLTTAAIGIAIVGYSDNVLTARAFAIRNGYKINANQELLALGMSNLVTGLIQGFPISSSGSRTAIGDSSGSKTQLFSIVALVVVILVLIFFRPLLMLFPKTGLGAIVIYAAIRLIDIPEFIRLQNFKLSEFRLAIITFFGVLATNILVGIGIAVALSVIDLFTKVARPHDAVLGTIPNLPGLHDIDDWEGATTISGLVIYRYDAPLCFANVENFKERAIKAIKAEIEPVEWFILNTEAIVEIDITAADMLEELRQELASRNITFGLARVKQDLYHQLQKSGLIDAIGSERIYLTLHTAIDSFQNRNKKL
ncbi:sulfate permease [Geminocystis sp. NIES-3708]|uniref:SulP family inorganic anion transporter n=1 Tax=Geminocystis sp. NIES-3708 TaxID=1615909 RepID=UPI0005FCB374|nr:sulfate permease [Geminocystis sp. NIES-3708]BAQ59679.1 sulfate permease [Geminocystis sp. NIES-3708]